MGIYEELVARGLIAQVTNEDEIRNMLNNGKAQEASALLYKLNYEQPDNLGICRALAWCLVLCQKVEQAQKIYNRIFIFFYTAKITVCRFLSCIHCLVTFSAPSLYIFIPQPA